MDKIINIIINTKINPGKANSNRKIIDNPKPIEPPISPDKM